MKQSLAFLFSLAVAGGTTATTAAAALDLSDVPSYIVNDVDQTELFQKIRQLAPSTQELPCDLECKNEGICTYIPGTIEDWRNFAQTGILVQKCACPDGFGGTGCEIPVEKCIMQNSAPPDDPNGEPTYRCQLSGKPCDTLPDGTKTCACHVADAVDPTLAGYACRRWNTEYCMGHLDVNAPQIYLCTNGGKCQSDFIAAQIAPGDFTVNQQYADAGCVCNQHFYGPHCEFLDFDAKHNIVMQAENGGIRQFEGDVEEDGNDGWQAKHFLAILVGVACVAVVAMALYRRRKRQAYRAALVASPREGVFRDDSVHDDDDDDEMNRQQNSDNDKNGTIEFADDNHHTNDPHNDLYAHEFADTTKAAAAPVMEDINLEAPAAAVEEEEESPDPLDAPVSASMPTLAKATSLQDDDDNEDPEDSLPYFT